MSVFENAPQPETMGSAVMAKEAPKDLTRRRKGKAVGKGPESNSNFTLNKPESNKINIGQGDDEDELQGELSLDAESNQISVKKDDHLTLVAQDHQMEHLVGKNSNDKDSNLAKTTTE